jgi:carboxyl-terminal processing protease
MLASGIAYVRLYTFSADSAGQVLRAVRQIAQSAPLKGVILDLRNNPGGYVDQARELLSAFAHHHVISYLVDGRGQRTAAWTDDSVPLLHLPLAVLIDAGSASSSELVAEAVKDLRAGVVVGQRSAGALAQAEFFALNDGGGIEITEDRVLGARAEIVDGVGITPDATVVASPLDLSAGHDPVIDRAVESLTSR